MSTVRRSSHVVYGCSYKDCRNTTTENDNFTGFFRFPVHNDYLQEEWLKNCGNMKLRDLPYKELKLRRLCLNHFDDNAFTDKSRKKLRIYAIPRHYVFGADLPSDDLVTDMGRLLKYLMILGMVYYVAASTSWVQYR